MLDRWGWVAVAVLAAALIGCKGEQPREEGGAPPIEQPAGMEEEGTPPSETPAPEMGETAGSEPMPRTESGEEAPAPGEAPAPAEQPAAQVKSPVVLEASWIGEGQGRKVAVKSGTEEVAEIDPAQPAVNDKVVTYLKDQHEAMVAAGVQPKVVVAVPVDMPFDQVGQPLMRAAFRAGFKASEVEYKPGGK